MIGAVLLHTQHAAQKKRADNASGQPSLPRLYVLREFVLEVVIQGLVNFLFPVRAVHFFVHGSHDLVHFLGGSQGNGAEGLATSGEGVGRVPTWVSAAAALPSVQAWAPTCIGLSLIPLFPLLDPPFERGIEKLLDLLWPVQQKKKAV